MISFFKSFVFTLSHIRRSDVIYSFFPGYHVYIGALFGKLFRKKVVIVIGGFESVWIPSINYGVIHKNTIYAKVVRQCLRWADVILSVDESLLDGMNYYADPSGRGYKIGIKNFIKDLKAKTLVVPTGYDADIWKIMPEINRTNSVVTVGNAHDHLTFKRKGFDFLISIAAKMPDVQFYFIGLGDNYKKFFTGIVTENCKFMGYVGHKFVPLELNKHKVFAQFSMSEGLPNSLCEAMLCGCIPVGSNVNGIPKAIAHCGYIIYKKDVDEAVQAIEKALMAEEHLGRQANQHITKLFDKKLRVKSLYEAVD
jgi:glycosyltransferase involved in cell wall biosynthesis